MMRENCERGPALRDPRYIQRGLALTDSGGFCGGLRAVPLSRPVFPKSLGEGGFVSR